MTRDEIQGLLARLKELQKWRKAAQSYAERYGAGGRLETRECHIARLAQADREIPEIEAKLCRAWE